MQQFEIDRLGKMIRDSASYDGKDLASMAQQRSQELMHPRIAAFVATWKPSAEKEPREHPRYLDDRFHSDLVMLIQDMHMASAEAMGKHVADVLRMVTALPAVVHVPIPVPGVPGDITYITPGMIKAGVDVFDRQHLAPGPSHVVMSIYAVMENARVAEGKPNLDQLVKR